MCHPLIDGHILCDWQRLPDKIFDIPHEEGQDSERGQAETMIYLQNYIKHICEKCSQLVQQLY